MTETTTETATLEATIDTYLEAYLEPDADRRAQLIEQVWAPDGHLFDPPLDAAGHAAINEMFETVQGMFAGHTFRRTSGIDSHHGIARYGWELVDADGAVALAGMDVAVVGQDGRLTRVAGFFGDLPARDS
jgi:ketosteroid isomerase-like protein